MHKLVFIVLVLMLPLEYSDAQTLLDADGVRDTYDLINSVLAPGYDVIEAPGTMLGDCDNHSAFGDHITQVFDDSLGIWVFAFHMHVDEDNDRCKNFDRQRCEIKTYDKSPDELLGVLGETVEFRWKFRLEEGFQPSSSFTHIHQLKSVGSPDDGMPLITLTPRKGTPDKLQLRYAAYGSQTTIHQVELDPLKGIWVEAVERVTYGEAGIGSYSLSLEAVHDGTKLMSYSSSTLRMWKTDSDFIRPKWGIYRSLNDAGNLRDEIVHFANFSIYEAEDLIDPSVAVSSALSEVDTLAFDIDILFSEAVTGFGEEDLVISGASVEAGSLHTSDRVSFVARLIPDRSGDVRIQIPADAAQDASANFNEASNELLLSYTGPNNINDQRETGFRVYPNPFKDVIHIRMPEDAAGAEFTLISLSGKVVFSGRSSGYVQSMDLSGYDPGVYILRIRTSEETQYQHIIKR